MRTFILATFLTLGGILFSGCATTVTNLQSAVYSQTGDYHHDRGAYRDAFEAFKKSAELGDGYSYYRLYGMYFNGQGVPKDNTIAKKMLEEAARLGYPAAEVSVANSLIFTTPRNRDMKRGLELLHSAASKEHPYAYADLYSIYWNGIGVKKDVAKAGEYYRLAKANGFDIRQTEGTAPAKPALSQRALITSVQQGLKDLGFYKGQTDGISGPMTRNAISTFQKFYGYPVNTNITQELVNTIKSKRQKR